MSQAVGRILVQNKQVSCINMSSEAGLEGFEGQAPTLQRKQRSAVIHVHGLKS